MIYSIDRINAIANIVSRGDLVFRTSNIARKHLVAPIFGAYTYTQSRVLKWHTLGQSISSRYSRIFLLAVDLFNRCFLAGFAKNEENREVSLRTRRSIEGGVAARRVASRRMNLLDNGFVYIYSWLDYQLTARRNNRARARASLFSLSSPCCTRFFPGASRNFLFLDISFWETRYHTQFPYLLTLFFF